MLKYFIPIMTLCLIAALIHPAHAAVNFTNRANDTVRLEVQVSGVMLGTFHLSPGESTPLGGTNREITIIIKTRDGSQQLTSGNFKTGEKVELVIEGGQFKLKKK